MKSIERILKEYGEEVSVSQDDITAVGKAIIQPMNRRWTTFQSDERIPTGILNKNHYYMIASPELNLSHTRGGTVESSDNSYYIRSCGDFKVKDEKIYVWAVLAARTEPLEDDYD